MFMGYIRIKWPSRKTFDVNPGGSYLSADIEIQFIPGDVVTFLCRKICRKLGNSYHTVVKKSGISSKCLVHASETIGLKKVIEIYINVNVPQTNHWERETTERAYEA